MLYYDFSNNLKVLRCKINPNEAASFCEERAKDIAECGNIESSRGTASFQNLSPSLHLLKTPRQHQPQFTSLSALGIAVEILFATQKDWNEKPDHACGVGTPKYY